MRPKQERPPVDRMELAAMRDGCTVLSTRLRYLAAACPPAHEDPYLGERINQVVAWLEELEQDLEAWQNSLPR